MDERKRTLPEALDAAKDGNEFMQAIQGLFKVVEKAMNNEREDDRMSTWRERAACNADNVNPEWFFPNLPGLAGKRAKSICAGCPVRDECLASALWEPVCGIWGGTTKSERVAMRRDMRMPLPSGWSARTRSNATPNTNTTSLRSSKSP